jgi:hypothetical protein
MAGAPEGAAGATESPRQILMERGWRQGSILPDNLNERVQPIPFAQGRPDPGWYVVCSQDCDILNSFDKEPAVEVIGVAPIDALRGHKTGARDPRELHVDSTETGESRPVALHAWTRGYLPKDLLLTETSAGHLGDNATQMMAAWLAGRYARLALPDEFVRRFRRAVPDLERLLEGNDDILDVWARIEPWEELGPDDGYAISVIIVATLETASAKDPRSMNRLKNEVRAELKRAIHRCEGIRVIQCHVEGPDDISFHDSQQFFPLGLTNG